MRDEPSVRVDEEDVLDEVRRLGLDPDFLPVSDLVAVLVEEALVRDSDAHRDRARGLRLHPDAHRHRLAHADLRDALDPLGLQIARELDLDVPRGELPAVLDLERILIPLPGLEPGLRDPQREVRVAVLDEVLNRGADGDFGLFDQDVGHRHVARAERRLRLIERVLGVAQFRSDFLRVRNHRGDGVDPGLVLLDERLPPALLESSSRRREAALESVGIARDDGLARGVEMGPRVLRGDLHALGLSHNIVQGLDLVHRALHDVLAFRF